MTGGETVVTREPVSHRRRQSESLVFVGNWGDHLHAAWFDPTSGTLSASEPVAAIGRSNWSVQHPTEPLLYVTDGATGELVALAVDRVSGTVSEADRVGAGGGLAHLHLDPRSQTIIGADYQGGGTVAFPLDGDGTFSGGVGRVVGQGSGPGPRQDGPHPHGVVVDPTGRYVVTADFGSDSLDLIGFDPKGGALTGLVRQYRLEAGSGPRHLAFHPTLSILYSIDESTGAVRIFTWSADEAELTQVRVVHTDGAAAGGELTVSSDGRFVYASHRGDHTIVVFAVDQSTGDLECVQRVPAGGEYPWSYAVDPSGRWLLVANMASDSVSTLEVDHRSGTLKHNSIAPAPFPKPVSVSFFA